ncbi:MAG: hypothetical protein IKY41_09210 [Clostridia bacterium]|nr:hypothetical protein [Clostridia bacterium]
MQDELIGIITTELAEQLKNGAGILLIIVSVSYVSSVFTATTGESDSGMKDIISFAVICLLCVPMMENVKNVITNATETIEEIKVVMLSSIPALCATQIGDAVAGAAIFITLTQTAAVLLSGIFLPLALAYTVVGICGSVSDRFSLDGVKGMVKYVFNWGLGLMMMGFSCAATLSGALTGAKTSMAARTLKYTGAMVPVVGRYLAESTDMVFAGASVIKSTAGIAAVTAILTAAAAPCVKMATHVLIYRIAGIMIRPVAAPKISNAVTNVGDAFMMITGITALMSVLSVLNVAVLVTLVRGGV